ncbi:hypothetical protein EDD37DRAFT_626938 [Exophiala viscosa]|uniref:Methyltransferase domain-containing protein n=1 Tax=Exophiala viscosa TaxID=2486360 RepID=A0AAN6DV48_9EURO|nr:hypothetical protein EDD36DRAFT_259515 [Exophiala viscosa]KAI1626319.1 hypothetical protein EDD37DRAFT_626938 [Exophiala viscosa]
MPSRPASTKAPSFSSRSYWDDRFTGDQITFEWLLSVGDTIAIINGIIVNSRIDGQGVSNDPKPRILHIGCGTSDLSLHLRELVRLPAQVHNVDFSEAAVEHGRMKELQSFHIHPASIDADRGRDGGVSGPAATEVSERENWMSWSTVDLLSLPSVESLVGDGGQLYDLIIDKSTSDAIACGDNITVMPLWVQPDGRVPISMDPVDLLALHLAAVTAPAGYWIVISYSANRFPFLESEAEQRDQCAEKSPSQHDTSRGVAPGRFWRLERKAQITVPATEEAVVGGAPGHTVHRPEIYHWLYVLIRTEALLGPGVEPPRQS